MYPFPRSLTGIVCLVLSLSYGCLQTNAAAARTLAYRLIDELDIGEARWTVKAKPNGPDLHLNGTVQQIYSQLLRINPNYNRDWNVSIPTIRNERDADRVAEEIATEIGLYRSESHHKRFLVQRSDSKAVGGEDENWLNFWTNSVLNIQCNLNHAKKDAIVEGASYLRGVKGQALLDPFAQKSCSRVSCSRDSGIIWCVHGSCSPPALRGEEPGYVKGFRPVLLESYASIGNLVTALLLECDNPDHSKYVSGRVFSRDDWYVSVERQKC